MTSAEAMMGTVISCLVEGAGRGSSEAWERPSVGGTMILWGARV